jgi:hypothetical protein
VLAEERFCVFLQGDKIGTGQHRHRKALKKIMPFLNNSDVA